MSGNNHARLRVLVLGCGSIGRRHIQNLQAFEMGEVCVFDPSTERMQAAVREFGVRAEARLETALAWAPDAVVVAAPTDQHVALATAVARQGCHLFVEKPLSHSLHGVEPLVDEVERRGLVSMVACNMRFHPGPSRVKRLVEEGAIGHILAARVQTGSFLPRWRPSQDYHESYSASPEWGGAVLDCIHEIDLALWYFGQARVCYALHVPAATIGLDTDGLAEILLEHRSGSITSLHLNFIQRDYRRYCQVIGSRGTIYWDFAERRVCVFGEDGQIARTYPEPEGWQLNQMYVDEMCHFVQAVRGGTPTVSPLSAGVEALRLAIAVREQGQGIDARWRQ